jgi:hypothetical protein
MACRDLDRGRVGIHRGVHRRSILARERPGPGSRRSHLAGAADRGRGRGDVGCRRRAGLCRGFLDAEPEGAEQAGRWKAFKSDLESVSRGKEPAIRPDFFERYLPYAAAFGLGTRWAKFFQKLAGVPLPAWLHAVDGSQADFGAIVAVMAASDSSAASAGAGAAGAAGASGGGASGAG